jgi:hypothetical protein
MRNTIPLWSITPIFLYPKGENRLVLSEKLEVIQMGIKQIEKVIRWRE